MSGALLEVRNLETWYGPIMAIRGVSLAVPEGGIVAVLGANGAGKTTLLKTISGVMDPDKGEVLLAGEPIEGGEPDGIVRKGVVHVPEGREVFPLLDVAENLAMGAWTRRDDGWARTGRWSSATSPSSRNGFASPPARFRAGSSRCSPSRAGSWQGRGSCCSTSRRSASLPFSSATSSPSSTA